MQQSNEEETSGFKDRERQRSSVTHSRQTLGAVGRVASRVRNSGISRLAKANSFLQRQKEGEANVNESPWGVGISLAAKVDNNLSLESRKSNDNGKDNSNVSPRVENRSDMVELSSPLSSDQQSPLRILEETLQNSSKEEDWHRKQRKSERLGNVRAGSDRKTEKRSERVSGVLGTAGTARGLVKSVSRFGFRTNDRKANAQGALNDLTKAKSTLAITSNDIKEAKRTSDVAEDTEIRRTSTKDHALSAGLPDTEAILDTKIRGFHLPGLGRGRNKQDDLHSKSKINERLKGDVARSKNKAGVEKSRVKPEFARSTSQAPTTSPRTNPYSKESPRNGPSSGKSDEGKRGRNKKSFKDFDQKPRKTRASWFGFSSDSGDSQTRGVAQTRAKSKDGRSCSAGEQDLESQLGSRMSAKASKDLAEMQDFAVDEYFDSDEDDMETGSAPRSMVDDDFITYQTGKGKKAQGNRSKSRMKS